MNIKVKTKVIRKEFSDDFELAITNFINEVGYENILKIAYSTVEKNSFIINSAFILYK